MLFVSVDFELNAVETWIADESKSSQADISGKKNAVELSKLSISTLICSSLLNILQSLGQFKGKLYNWRTSIEDLQKNEDTSVTNDEPILKVWRVEGYFINDGYS